MPRVRSSPAPIQHGKWVVRKHKCLPRRSVHRHRLRPCELQQLAKQDELEQLNGREPPSVEVVSKVELRDWTMTRRPPRTSASRCAGVRAPAMSSTPWAAAASVRLGDTGRQGRG